MGDVAASYTCGKLLPVADRSTHSRQQISRNQLLKYLLLVGTLTLAISIWAVRLRATALTTVSLTQVHNIPSTVKYNTTPTTNGYPSPRIGKLTASFGPPHPIYEAAIASHREHNELHGYAHYILREHMIRGLWAKHGFLLTVLGAELSKPEDQRLEWLMWHDRDVVLMNAQIPLHVFLPPSDGFAHVNLVVAKDRNGLNNGVFMVRVGQWAMKMFASALSVREYMPGTELKYSEQSAMEMVIARPWWNSSVVYVPQRWFNGFPPPTSAKHAASTAAAKPGSLLIHFASDRDGRRPERMAKYLTIANSTGSEWDRSLADTGYETEIKEYWMRVADGEKFDDICADIGARNWG